MIRLAGLIPYEDIDIQFTGLRPGEKLFELINGSSQEILAGHHEKIRIISEQPMSWAKITSWIEELEELLATRHEPKIIAHIRKLVPEYNSATNQASNPGEGRALAESNQPLYRLATRDKGQPGCRERNGNAREPAHRNGSGSTIACES
jgi:hypothetical protein